MGEYLIELELKSRAHIKVKCTSEDEAVELAKTSLADRCNCMCLVRDLNVEVLSINELVKE